MILRRGQISRLKGCRRKYFFRDIEGLVPKTTAKALKYGTIAHAFWEGLYGSPRRQAPSTATRMFWEAVETEVGSLPVEDDETRLDIAKLFQMVLGYKDYYWKGDCQRFKFIATEYEFGGAKGIPIGNTGLYLGGRADCVWEEKSTGKIWLVEHKTASNIAVADDIVLDIGDQPSYYLWAAEHEWPGRVGGLIWDVMKKSKKGVTQKDLKQCENDPAVAEKMFLERLFQEIDDNPRDFFQRRPIRRNKNELKEIGRELEYLGSLAELLHQHPDNEASFYRNPTGECRWRCSYPQLCIKDTEAMREAQFTQHKTEEEEEEETDE